MTAAICSCRSAKITKTEIPENTTAATSVPFYFSGNKVHTTSRQTAESDTASESGADCSAVLSANTSAEYTANRAVALTPDRSQALSEPYDPAADTYKTTAAPTAKPTAAPTAKPTPAPASKYPWSNETTGYLLDINRGIYALREEAYGTTESAYPAAKGTVFGKCAKAANGGIHLGKYTNIQNANKNGIILQAVTTRRFNNVSFEWEDCSIVDGVYLDIGYTKPGAAVRTELTLEQSAWYKVLKEKINGVEIIRMRALKDNTDYYCNFYPLLSGDFVLDLGGCAVILNKTPKSVP